MKLFSFLILAGALATGGYFGYQHFNPSEETKIRERMEEFAALISLEANSGNIRRGLMVEQFPRFFAQDCEIKVWYKGMKTFSGRADMAAAARAYAGLQGGIKVEFHDLSVTVDHAKKAASGKLTTTMLMTDTDTLSAQEFKFELLKEEGKWLIHRAESQESLAR